MAWVIVSITIHIHSWEILEVKGSKVSTWFHTIELAWEGFWRPSNSYVRVFFNYSCWTTACKFSSVFRSIKSNHVGCNDSFVLLYMFHVSLEHKSRKQWLQFLSCRGFQFWYLFPLDKKIECMGYPQTFCGFNFDIKYVHWEMVSIESICIVWFTFCIPNMWSSIYIIMHKICVQR